MFWKGALVFLLNYILLIYIDSVHPLIYFSINNISSYPASCLALSLSVIAVVVGCYTSSLIYYIMVDVVYIVCEVPALFLY